ncbi:flagellar hook-associated protein FlgK [Pseudomonas sp. HR96]|uniref:flagellar hook-associated protein FlgK n=1 Tax=Pseudomonas sp. HR96 TaxID=1027966 RepID=UPI002A74A031|nr:flagellar hook-associated protein FlgK [Pseudomonas sp. HR96]WPP00081.1 flagellar hook-associated protein FlgK [Pseudomonas sp. HR96]
MSIMSQIGFSGVNAAQIAMNTTAQNLANLNTPGFSRLTTAFTSVGGQGGRIGGGVEVSGIRRMTSDFNNQQLWRAGSQASYHNGAGQYLGGLEKLMAGEGSSISVGLDKFFAALSEASTTPENIALRQQIISEARNLTQRFNGLNRNISDQLGDLRQQRSSMTSEVNGVAANIAVLNRRIADAQATGQDSSALRDQRETLVAELGQFAELRVRENPSGALDISFANGQPLVAGNTAATLQVTTLADGAQQLSLSFAGTAFPLQQERLGGSLGALHRMETEQLLPTRAALREMAGEMAAAINATLATGFDLDGNPGQALLSFNPANGQLELTDLRPEQLAFSSVAGEHGNNEVLLALLELKNREISIGGRPVMLNDAYAGLLGNVASASRQNLEDFKTAMGVLEHAQNQRDSLSAVSENEEAINLMTFQRTYQANMKVIETANQLFDSMLAAF